MADVVNRIDFFSQKSVFNEHHIKIMYKQMSQFERQERNDMWHFIFSELIRSKHKNLPLKSCLLSEIGQENWTSCLRIFLSIFTGDTWHTHKNGTYFL